MVHPKASWYSEQEEERSRRETKKGASSKGSESSRFLTRVFRKESDYPSGQPRILVQIDSTFYSTSRLKDEETVAGYTLP